MYVDIVSYFIVYTLNLKLICTISSYNICQFNFKFRKHIHTQKNAPNASNPLIQDKEHHTDAS